MYLFFNVNQNQHIYLYIGLPILYQTRKNMQLAHNFKIEFLLVSQSAWCIHCTPASALCNATSTAVRPYFLFRPGRAQRLLLLAALALTDADAVAMRPVVCENELSS